MTRKAMGIFIMLSGFALIIWGDAVATFFGIFVALAGTYIFWGQQKRS